MLDGQHIVSNSDRHRAQLEDYLETVLQQTVCLREWGGRERLPVFLPRLYRFLQTRVGQTPLLFMCATGSEEHTPADIARHLELAKSEFDGIVVYSTERLAASFRARLISGGMAFAVAGNQLFIPELATDLREHFRAPKPGRPDKLTPSAQVVLFFHLLKGEREQVWTPTALTEHIQYSIMTMSRALDELAGAGLAWTERRGRRKQLSFRAEGRLLIDMAKTLLIRPERRLDYVHWLSGPPDLPLAGEHALARLSDLSPPSTPPVYAVTSAQMRDLLAAGRVDLREASYDSDGTLGTWRYDPQLLAGRHEVDPLSLYAQFWDHPNERISMAVDKLVERWAW